MNLQESDIDIAQVIVVSFVWIANEQFTLGVVVFQPIFQGSTYEAASDNSNFNHMMIVLFYDVLKKACKVTTFFLNTQARAQFFYNKVDFTSKKLILYHFHFLFSTNFTNFATRNMCKHEKCR